jgi:hypothetical protein
MSELTSHRFPGDDRKVQRVEFADGVWAEFDTARGLCRVGGVRGFRGDWEKPCEYLGPYRPARGFRRGQGLNAPPGRGVVKSRRFAWRSRLPLSAGAAGPSHPECLEVEAWPAPTCRRRIAFARGYSVSSGHTSRPAPKRPRLRGNAMDQAPRMA